MHPYNDQKISSLSILIKLFLLFIIIPTEQSFYIGSVRITPYRIILILSFIPCFIKLFNNSKSKTIPTDWFILGYCIWGIISIYINHDLSTALKSGGIFLLESLGSYLLARAYIANECDFVNFINILIMIVIGLSFISIIESLTGYDVLKPNIVHIGKRMGFWRAFGPFDHPILHGVFCASALSFSLFVPFNKFLSKFSRKVVVSLVTIAAISSLSSGALGYFIIIIFFVCYDAVTRNIKSRWTILSLFIIGGYIFASLFSNRNPVRAIISRVTFTSSTAYYRMLIWDYGIKYNVSIHPIFGIGFKDWARPSWMVSDTIDNFWLVLMIQFGIPSFLMLIVGIIFLMIRFKNNVEKKESDNLLVKSYIFSIIGFIFSASTVHLWNSLYIWFFFLIGCGKCLTNKATNRT